MNFGKLAWKVLFLVVGSTLVGYAEYRVKGGPPIRELYNQIQNERLAAVIAKAKRDGIVVEGSVE